MHGSLMKYTQRGFSFRYFLISKTHYLTHNRPTIIFRMRHTQYYSQFLLVARYERGRPVSQNCVLPRHIQWMLFPS